MMRVWILFLISLAVFGCLAYGWRQSRILSGSIRRLLETDEPSRAGSMRRIRRFKAAPVWIPLAAGAAVFAFFVGGVLPDLRYSIAFAIVAGLLIWQMQEIRFMKRVTRMEEQLADMIDLMASALQAGSSATASLETAVREMDRPLKPFVQDLLSRMRFGDRPADAFQDFGNRVPLEAFRIFSLTMSVHWGTGGRLVPLLASVSRTLRDRIEVSRQIRVQSAQGRISAVTLLGASYFIFAVVWRSNPQYLEAFLVSTVGSVIAAGAVLLQGAGLVWIHLLTRVRY